MSIDDTFMAEQPPEPLDDAFNELENDLDELIEQAAFGDAIRVAVSNPAVELVLAKAKDAYLSAVKDFAKLDLSASNGLHQAMHCQNEMNRFTDMVQWIAMAVKTGKSAAKELRRRDKADREARGRGEFYGSEQRNG